MVQIDGEMPVLKQGMNDPVTPNGTWWISRAQKLLGVKADGDYGKLTAAALKDEMSDHPDNRSSANGSVIGEPEWRRLFGLW